MAVLALGLVGAGIGSAIGGTFLGMTAASIGWTVGTIVGNLAFAKDQRAEGARLGDLSVQASTYGIMKPVLYGTMRVAGNVFFCTDKREVVTETSEGGKGGPKVTQTTYSYNVDIAIGLCEGPIAGIRKIWRNGELIYDVSVDGDVGTILGSSIKAEGMAVYLGTEDQLPDPTIEATTGAGQTPAYRGMAYVVFDHLDCPNGQIPLLHFEVATVSEEGSQTSVYSEAPATDSFVLASVMADRSFQFRSGQEPSDIYTVGPNYAEFERTTGLFSDGSGRETDPIPAQGGPYALFAAFSSAAYSTPMYVYAVNLETGERTLLLEYTPGSSGNSLRPARAAFDRITEKFVAIAFPTETGEASNAFTILPGGVRSDNLDTQGVALAFYDDVVYLCGNHDGETFLQMYDGTTGAFLDEIGAGAEHDVENLFVHVDEGGIFIIENPTAEGGYATERNIWKVTDEWVNLCSDAHWDNLNDSVRTFYANDRYAILGPGSAYAGDVPYYIVNYSALNPDTVPLADVIEDIATRSGLDISQVDTTGLTDEVNGYALSQVAGGRSNLDPLLAAFSIDTCESDGKVKFRKRALQDVVATIAFEELGAVDAGGSAEDPFQLHRIQESELPRSMAVTFPNLNSDYQPGTETARRQVTESINDITVNLPIATYPDHMAEVAAIMLYDAWLARNRRRLNLTRKWAWLDVGDNIAVEYPAGTTSTKRIVRMVDTGLRLEIELVDADPSLYDVTIPGATPDGGQDGIAFAYPSKLALLDIPILRDADDDNGLYAAGRNVVDAPWPGALVYKSDGTNFQPQAQLSTESAIGVTLTALDDWAGINGFDEASSVQVDVGHSELASSTRTALLAGTANAMLIGSEIVQFHTATEDSPGVYTLTGFLRGRRGTEWAMTGHAAGERVVLLTAAGLRRIEMELDEVGDEVDYKPVTIGASLDATPLVAFTNTAIGKKPFRPWDLRTSDESGERVFTWKRRSRLSTNILTDSCPLGEDQEEYDVELVDGDGNVVFEDTVFEPQATVSPLVEAYTLEVPATQLVDYGSEVLGLLDDYPASQYETSIKVYDPATGVQTAGVFVGDAVPDLLLVGTDVYVTVRIPADLDSFVYRYTAADISGGTGPTASRPGALATPFAGLAYDGTYIWTARGNDEIQKLNATTLDVEDVIPMLGEGIVKIAHDSGYLYLSGVNGILKYNIGTDTVDLTIPDDGGNMRIIGDLLFAYAGVYDKATGAKLYSVDAVNQAPYGPGHVVVGSEVVYANAEAGELVFLDSATGVETRRLGITDLYAVAGTDGSDYLYVSRRVGHSSLETVALSLTEDLSGLTFKVYQVSAQGRGYPAELAL